MSTYHYIRPDGTFFGSYGGGKPTNEDAYPLNASDLIDVSNTPPEFGDQVWQFPGWSESPSQNILRETTWRNEEMEFVANQLIAIEDEAPDALPGTLKQWRDYRTKVRLWPEAEGYPNEVNRPARPGVVT